ncbi:uncharacterized protein LOC106652459 [Trichogramma pretiosum]|uniref:Uncharacterized protein n=1 Tax=Trichogramma kaykai TaxID=54128 RepID=A0ABD2X7G6_9HYME|nr:uncharacterized protein LOC106652459 [Trichogramma pretiosum]
MPIDSRSVSFIFHRENTNAQNSPQNCRSQNNIRQRLQDKFEKENIDEHKRKSKNKVSNEKSWQNLSLEQVSMDSRRVLRNGANRISKTISSVKSTFGSMSQKFKSSTRRRQRLEEQQSPDCSALKSQTPQTRSRDLLGRTPTKLYSPFGIESPRYAWDSKTECMTPSSTTSTEFAERKSYRLFRFRKVNNFCALR